MNGQRRWKLTAPVVCALAGAVTACGGTQAERSAYPEPPAALQQTVRRGTAGDVVLDVALKGEGGDTSRSLQMVRDVREMRTVLIHPVEGPLDTIRHHIVASGAADGSQLTLTAEDRWVNAAAVQYDSLIVRTLITTGDGTVYAVSRGYSLPPETDRQQAVVPLTLKGWVEEAADSSVLFVVLAERHRVLDNEYFPSSEHLRVIITDEDGSVVWNSAAARLFMQMINPVEPKNVGEVRRYELAWNGRDDTGTPLPPGRYKATLILPAKPQPYSTVIDFPWREGE